MTTACGPGRDAARGASPAAADPASPGPFAPEDGGGKGCCGLSDDDDVRILLGRGGGEAPRGALAGLRGRDGGASRTGAFFNFFY